MLLVIDIGNTNIVFGVFDGDRLRTDFRMQTNVHRMPDEYGVWLLQLLQHRGFHRGDIRHVILGSVVPPLVTTFEEVAARYLGIQPLVVQAGIKTGVRICIDNPREVGADRVINTLAAHRLYGGPAIVIDFGTATTFDAVSSEGDYLGGAIAPGLEISAETLYERAAKLQRVELIRPKSAIGKNTVAAMQSGIIFGYVGLVEGVIQRIKRELDGHAQVIATGGLAPLIARETDLVDVINPQLTLVGLRLIHEINQLRPK